MVEQNDVKRTRLEQLLELGMVMVHLDARRPGVSVPPELADEAHLRLNVSYRFRPSDLQIDDAGAQITLTFNGVPWLCVLPFEAVFGFTSHISGESLLWLEDVPEEVLLQIAAPDVARPVAQAHSPASSFIQDQEPQRRRAHLRVVK